MNDLSEHALFASRKSDAAELKKHAQFAINIINHLEREFDVRTGTWKGESAIKDLAYTCQAVEALSLLNLAPITDHMIRPALTWLTDLELGRNLDEDELRSAHLFPSRFKTVAGLGRFESVRLIEDFHSLCTCLDINQGTMQNVPTEIRHELVTMIWLDTFIHMEQNGEDITAWIDHRQAANAWLERALHNWLHPAKAQKTSRTYKRPSPRRKKEKTVSIANWGDASYALDLLLRSDIWNAESPDVQEMARNLVDIIRKRVSGDLREWDPIYCAIQLSTHFRKDGRVQNAVLDLIHEIEDRYHAQNFKQPISFHALLLRLLVRYHGPALRDEIIRSQWTERHEAEIKKQRDDESRANEELARLLQTTFRVQIGSKERISGSPARNEILRVSFGFNTPATNEYGHPVSQPSQSLHFIIKRGTIGSLQRAIERYNALPPEVQRHFAHHAGSFPPSSHDPNQLWFLLMQDLSEMRLLVDIIKAADVPHSLPEDHEQIPRAVRAVGTAFRGLHETNRRAQGTTNQLDRLYILPMTEALDTICESQNYPKLKPFVDEGFVANGRFYKRLANYLQALKASEAKALRPPILSRIHSDAHSRNIMLARDLSYAKFVDVEGLADNQDYLADYALLIEDIAFYRLLPPNDPHQRIKTDDFASSVAGAGTEERQNTVRYPAFPLNSETAQLFQQELLAQVKQFADSNGDEHWQKRLWLAIARALLLLVDRQTNNGRLRTMSGSVALDMVVAAYAESIRLLDELIANLENPHQPLPPLPFSGQHRPSAAMDGHSLVQEVMALFKKLPDVKLKNVPDAKAWIRYYTRDSSQPFAEFRTSERKGEIMLILFAPRHQLDDPEHLLSGRSEDHKGWVVRKPELANTAAVDALIQSSFRAMLRQEA